MTSSDENPRIKSFVDEFTFELKNRMKSKLIFSYILSWIVINWKVLAYLFFSNDIIETKLKSNLIAVSSTNMWLPLIGVAIYVLFIPPLGLITVITSNWISRSLEIRKIKQELQIRTKEYELKREYQETRNRYYEALETEPLISKLENQIERFDKELKEKDEQIRVYQESMDLDTFSKYNAADQQKAIKLMLSILSKDFNRISMKDVDPNDQLFFRLLDEGYLRAGTQNYYLTEKGKFIASRYITTNLKY